MSWDSAIRAMLERRKKGCIAFMLRTGLLPASLLYKVGIKLRNKAYLDNWIVRSRAPLPVISIGNITGRRYRKNPICYYALPGCLRVCRSNQVF